MHVLLILGAVLALAACARLIDPPAAGPDLERFVPGYEFHVAGARYRVVGPPSACGWVPVSLIPAPGMVAPAVLYHYRPASGELRANVQPCPE